MLEHDSDQDDDEEDVSDEGSDEDETPVNQKSKGKSESTDAKVFLVCLNLFLAAATDLFFVYFREQKEAGGKEGDPKQPQKVDEDIKTKMDFLLNW